MAKGHGNSMKGTRRRRGKKVYPSAGIVHEGPLEEEGYNLHEGSEARESALNKSVRRYGYARTVEKVNALHVVNKGNPENYHKTGEDLSYLEIHREALGAKTPG